MLIDLSLPMTKEAVEEAVRNKGAASLGHFGTHVDLVGKEFPLSYLRRKGVVFDVSAHEGMIDVRDVDASKIEKEMFVALYTGFSDSHQYGSPAYVHEHPQLSSALIEELLKRQVSIIGVDFAGIRRPDEHAQIDRYCAEKGVFIV